MNQRTSKIGELECTLVDTVAEGAQPSMVVIFCHGYGASGEDLVPISAEILQANPTLVGKVRFVFPKAPILLGGMGGFESRAWWNLDVERINAMLARGEERELTDEKPEGMEKARRKLLGLISEVGKQTGLPMSRIALGGFSQGAMLTTDTALRLEEAPAALAIWSGTLLNESEWRSLAKKRVGLKVVQSHGRQDPLLPYAMAEKLSALLTDSGLKVRFLPFDGPHTISRDAILAYAELLGTVID
jgi:phospholipase/carboxylesterase